MSKFNVGDLVKHPLFSCYGIIAEKDQQTRPWTRYCIRWADASCAQSWERKEDLILVARVNDEQSI